MTQEPEKGRQRKIMDDIRAPSTRRHKRRESLKVWGVMYEWKKLMMSSKMRPYPNQVII